MGAIFDAGIARIRLCATCSRKIFFVNSDAERYLNRSLEVNLIGLESLKASRAIIGIFHATSRLLDALDLN
jgi:hypothetical protein